jgi:glycerol-3-phosphate dehydrogenase
VFDAELEQRSKEARRGLTALDAAKAGATVATWCRVESFLKEERLADVLIRRTQIFYRAHDQGLGVAPKVADRMADLLDWSATRRHEELEMYAAEVALSRQWREE